MCREAAGQEREAPQKPHCCPGAAGCRCCRSHEMLPAPDSRLQVRGVPALTYFGQQVWR